MVGTCKRACLAQFSSMPNGIYALEKTHDYTLHKFPHRYLLKRMATRSFWCASYTHGKETHWWKIGLPSEDSSDGRTHQMYELRTGK